MGRPVLRATSCASPRTTSASKVISSCSWATKYPHRAKHQATEAERKIWENRRAGFMAEARAGLTVKEALAYVNHPGWQWHGDQAAAAAAAQPPA